MNTNRTNNQKQNFDISWIQKDTRCWVYQPNETYGDIYQRGVIKAIIPLTTNKSNSRVTVMLQNGTSFETRANQIEKCRESNSLQRDLIQMDIINTPEILRQLKRRLLQRNIHTLMWNSLIIVNPFKIIPEQYGQKCLNFYYDHIFTHKEDMRKHQPHIYSFMMNILSNISETTKTQVISISGESGSGKTETNKEALKAITFCSSQMFRGSKSGGNSIQPKILKCDQILEVFGNAKTVKNDNSSRFGKLFNLEMDSKTFKIRKSYIKNYFLEKTRIIVQNSGERNFHIFYQLLAYLSEEQRSALRLKSGGHMMRADDFKYLSNRNTIVVNQDRKMWQELNQALIALDFGRELVSQIWRVIAAILILGNLEFEINSDNQPCDIRNPEVGQSIAFLLGIQKKQFIEALTTQKIVVAGQSVTSPLSISNCALGRDSVAKAMYESLFNWIIMELNTRLNVQIVEQGESKVLKLLDIYGFEVFDHNSFEQLCVNFTNQKIHQIYLQQIFIHEKEILRKEGLEFVIQKLNFTDNFKIIQLIQTLHNSVFNLLDQTCLNNVKDDQFLNSLKKQHENHQHFPSKNQANIRRTFIIKHTPGDIEYVAQGFKDKNKDFIRLDLLSRLANVKIKLIKNLFHEKWELLKQEGNKRYLGINIRKQVKDLITQMSFNTDLHFIRCIKSNEKKQPFTFVDQVCLNQIRYLGILDTIQMRKDTYHIRIPYQKFYKKYGILENKLNILISVSEGRINMAECKQISVRFVNDLRTKHDLDYQFGRESIFLKMATQNILDALLKKKLTSIDFAASRIKAQYRYRKMKKAREIVNKKLPIIQRALSNFLLRVRIFKRKNAVLKIENGWEMNQEVFFVRKKLPFLKILQKCIKGRIEQQKAQKKRKAVIRAKQLLKSLASANILQQKISNFKDVKHFILQDFLYSFQKTLEDHYLKNLSKYLKGGANILANAKAIKKADEATFYRLSIRYKRVLQKYLKSYSIKIKFDQKLAAILKIQSFYRMLRHRRKYLSLRKQTIKIQRNWRKYYEDKQFSLKFTQNFFQNGEGGKIKQERSYWRSLLHRNIVKNQEKGVEKLLLENERVRMDKIGLFYYLLDFEILTELSNLYPNNSWIQNYCSLFQQSWNKGNPIQMVDVSDTQTIVSTLNKAYVWGDVHFQNFDPDNANYKSWTKINSLQTPPGRLNKIHAHCRFSVVQIQDQEPFIVGDQNLYQLDCSSKEWKTLNQSYIIINGTVLTLKKVEFSRLSIAQKVTQLSCGMSHCIAKSSLRKVYTWGDNSKGQLGLGLTRKQRILKPKLMQYFVKHAIIVHQVSASANSCMILESNNRILWWGSNGTISLVNSPKQMYLFQKSAFLDNPQKYTVIRLVTSWSKSLSIIGVTVAAHEGIFKSSQNAIKKKTYENLIIKWNEDIRTVMPPSIQTVSGYFQQKFMPKSKVEAPNKGLKELEHQRIRQKLLSEIILMEEAERALLKQRKKI